ncbi:pyridoxal-phosphate dependent enzyme [Nocardia grenadensis]|uniref:pyridoxal-phosphate dependent enzyme n=1 Tax=Nocardia grenadensis TaxID=931537 RepID=UPI003D75C2ED
MNREMIRLFLESAARTHAATTAAVGKIAGEIHSSSDYLLTGGTRISDAGATAVHALEDPARLLAPTSAQRIKALALLCESGFPSTRTVSVRGDLDWRTSVDLHLALENISRDTGSVKDRAARLLWHQVKDLTPGTRCVIASSGNHGIAYARSCLESGVALTVVVPRNTSQLKVTKLENYGATVIRHGETWDQAYDYAKQFVRDTESHLLDLDAPESVAALGTVVHEMLFRHPDTDAIVLPGGGGTIMTGAQIVREFEEMSGRQYLVLGACPADSPTLAKSLETGIPRTAEANTIAEAMKVETVPVHLFGQIRTGVDDIITVPDRDIERGVVLLSDAVGHPVEAAGAVGAMAVLRNDGLVHGVFGDYDLRDKKVVTVVTGGNISSEDIDFYRRKHF